MVQLILECPDGKPTLGDLNLHPVPPCSLVVWTEGDVSSGKCGVNNTCETNSQRHTILNGVIDCL